MNHGRRPVPRYAPAPPPSGEPTVADLVRLVRAADARRITWAAGPVVVAPAVLARKSSQGRRTGGTRPGAKFLHDGRGAATTITTAPADGEVTP